MRYEVARNEGFFFARQKEGDPQNIIKEKNVQKKKVDSSLVQRYKDQPILAYARAQNCKILAFGRDQNGPVQAGGRHGLSQTRPNQTGHGPQTQSEAQLSTGKADQQLRL